MVEVGGSNPPGPTNFLSRCFYSILFFQNRAFWRVSVRGRYLIKVVTGQLPCKGSDQAAHLYGPVTITLRTSTRCGIIER